MGNKDFKIFGKDFQYRLIKQIILDKKFAASIIPILNPNYFDDSDLRILVSVIINAFTKDDIHLNYETLKIRVLSHDFVKGDMLIDRFNHLIEAVKEKDDNDFMNVREIAILFCKKQELKKAVDKVSKIIEKDDLEEYLTCEMIIKEALSKGVIEDNTVMLDDDIDETLSDDFREVIPTKITGFDVSLGGGLGKGELGLVIAPLGTGKTTLATYFCGSAMAENKTAVQIFFEDSPKQIRRKHLARWSGISLNDLNEKRDEVKERFNEFKQTTSGQVILQKFSSSGTKMTDIRKFLNKLISNGVDIGLVTIDYIDCIVSTKSYTSEYGGEGDTMRECETLADDLQIPMWVFTQGNRQSITSEVVTSDQIAGSIKKAQIGHFIASIAKSLEQKEQKRATISVLKSRFGDDGQIFENISFDNGKLVIDTDSSTNMVSFLDKKHQKEEKQLDLLRRLAERKNKKQD